MRAFHAQLEVLIAVAVLTVLAVLYGNAVYAYLFEYVPLVHRQ